MNSPHSLASASTSCAQCLAQTINYLAQKIKIGATFKPILCPNNDIKAAPAAEVDNAAAEQDFSTDRCLPEHDPVTDSEGVTAVDQKVAVDMMTKCADLEYAPYNIRVVAVAPGRVNPPILEAYKTLSLYDHIKREQMRKTLLLQSA